MRAVFTQDKYRVRLDWGTEGVSALAECAVLIIVDVLSFSTSTSIVTARGSRVLPLSMDDPAQVAAAREQGAILAGDREWTLRPASLTTIESGVSLALPSPNGATLSRLAAETGAQVLAGCLRNASAVAARAVELADGASIGVLAAGERWGVRSGPLRPSVEDHLGAGAVLNALAVPQASPEAKAAMAVAQSLPAVDTLWHSASGRELREGGHDEDVLVAAELDADDTAPLLVDGSYR